MGDSEMTVGGMIRKIRTDKNVTRETLAEAVGVTFQQIQKYESGRNKVSTDRLDQIAGALKVPVTQFFPLVPGKPVVLDEDEVSLLNEYRNIKQNDLKKSVRLIMKHCAGNN